MLCGTAGCNAVQPAGQQNVRVQLADALAAKAQAESELMAHSQRVSAPAAGSMSASEILELQAALLQVKGGWYG